MPGFFLLVVEICLLNGLSLLCNFRKQVYPGNGEHAAQSIWISSINEFVAFIAEMKLDRPATVALNMR